MKLKSWRRLFAQHILERGEAYFWEDAVEALDWDGEMLSATVRGTDSYHVEIFVNGGRIEDMSCTCPYAEDGQYCKHMAAVLFEFEERDIVPVAEEKNQKSEQAESGGTLEALVNAMSEAEAKQLLLRLGREIGAAETQIRLIATGKVPQKQKKDWLSQIRRMHLHYEDRHGFIDYAHSADFTTALDRMLEEAVPMLLEASMPAEAFEIVCAAYEEASSAGMDDDGGCDMLYESCAEYWREILSSADGTQLAEMHQWFLKNVQSNTGDTDALRSVLFGEFRDETLLQKNLELLDRWIAELDGNSYQRYYLEVCLQYRLRTMEALSISPEEREAWMLQYYRIPFVRGVLIERAKEAGDWDEALRILRESLQIDCEYPGLTNEYSKQIIAILRRQGRIDALREALLTYVSEHSQRDLDYIRELKELTPPDNWEKLRETLLQTPGMQGMGEELLLEEGLYRALMDRLLRKDSIYLMDRYAPKLKDKFPEELLGFYLPKLRDSMRGASNRSRYTELCATLKQLQSYKGGREKANGLAEEWRQAYPRRRAMLEELKKAGF